MPNHAYVTANQIRRREAQRSWEGHLLTFGFGMDNSEAERRLAAYDSGESYPHYMARTAADTLPPILSYEHVAAGLQRARQAADFYHFPFGIPYKFATGGYVSPIREAAAKTMAEAYHSATLEDLQNFLPLPPWYSPTGRITWTALDRRFALARTLRNWERYLDAEFLKRIVEDAFACLKPKESPMPPLKIMILCHFSYATGPWPGDMSSAAYVQFVNELERTGLIRAVGEQERNRAGVRHWHWKTTERGDVLVQAFQDLPLPVEAAPRWEMPKS